MSSVTDGTVKYLYINLCGLYSGEVSTIKSIHCGGPRLQTNQNKRPRKFLISVADRLLSEISISGRPHRDARARATEP